MPTLTASATNAVATIHQPWKRAGARIVSAAGASPVGASDPNGAGSPPPLARLERQAIRALDHPSARSSTPARRVEEIAHGRARHSRPWFVRSIGMKAALLLLLAP